MPVDHPKAKLGQRQGLKSHYYHLSMESILQVDDLAKYLMT